MAAAKPRLMDLRTTAGLAALTAARILMVRATQGGVAGMEADMAVPRILPLRLRIRESGRAVDGALLSSSVRHGFALSQEQARTEFEARTGWRRMRGNR